MTTCPKCGSQAISGPSYYRESNLSREYLRYTCIRCGYSKLEPTLDQRQDEPEVDKP